MVALCVAIYFMAIFMRNLVLPKLLGAFLILDEA